MGGLFLCAGAVISAVSIGAGAVMTGLTFKTVRKIHLSGAGFKMCVGNLNKEMFLEVQNGTCS